MKKKFVCPNAQTDDAWIMDLSQARLLELSGHLLPGVGIQPDSLTLARQQAIAKLSAPSVAERAAAGIALRNATIEYLTKHRALDFKLNPALDRPFRFGMAQFTEYGCLPPGRYVIDWSEVERQFGFNSARQRLISDLSKALTVLNALTDTVWLGGSFVTLKPNPADVDLMWKAPSGTTYDGNLEGLPDSIDAWFDEAWKVRILENSTIWRGSLPEATELSTEQARMLPHFRAVGLIELRLVK